MLKYNLLVLLAIPVIILLGISTNMADATSDTFTGEVTLRNVAHTDPDGLQYIKDTPINFRIDVRGASFNAIIPEQVVLDPSYDLTKISAFNKPYGSDTFLH